MENLTKEDLELINNSLHERFNNLDRIFREGLTAPIRKLAQEERNATMKTWEKIAKIVEQ